MPIRILIADDHEIVQSGLKLILDSQDNMTVVGEAQDGVEAISVAEALLPDILLIDISMPEINGIEATRIISERCPSVKTIILSMNLFVRQSRREPRGIF